MREDYVPNEKYRNMFGVERNGYGMERVDLYLAQLEVAFKKIREDNRNLKRELSDRAAGGGGAALSPDTSALEATIGQQEQYIAQVQAQLAQEQEQSRRLLEQLNELSMAPPPPPMGTSPATEALLAQLNTLRAEADELRHQLRRQQQQQQQAMPAAASAFAPVYAPPPALEPEDKTNLIGKVLVEARMQAEELLRAAQTEADQLNNKTRRRTEELRAEYDRIYSQLQGIHYALRNVLRDNETDYRGEEFAAS